jgi:RNA polymerase sigma-70 factor (ECF subfamily)
MRKKHETESVRVINLFKDPPLGGREPMAPSEAGTALSADAKLVRELQADSQEALRKLMNAYWGPLVGFAGRILGGRGEPEELVQTAFVRLWTRRHELDETGSLRSLLYTIVRNASLDELRKRGRRESAEEGTPHPSAPRTPYEDVQGAELQRLAAAAVSRLPERRREVFRMVREEGLSYQEIADVLGLSAQTVANHMSLAMADLRTTLRPYLSHQDAGDAGSQDGGLDREQIDG